MRAHHLLREHRRSNLAGPIHVAEPRPSAHGDLVVAAFAAVLPRLVPPHSITPALLVARTPRTQLCPDRVAASTAVHCLCERRHLQLRHRSLRRRACAHRPAAMSTHCQQRKGRDKHMLNCPLQMTCDQCVLRCPRWPLRPSIALRAHPGVRSCSLGDSCLHPSVETALQSRALCPDRRCDRRSSALRRLS